MTSIGDLSLRAVDKEQFTSTQSYIDFALSYLDFIGDGLQATVVAQNNHTYKFFQYREEAGFRITRPINNELFLFRTEFEKVVILFRESLLRVRENEVGSPEHRESLRTIIYTLQQSIGCALDALPASSSNQARKINGDLFERLIQLVLKEMGFECTSGVTKVPVKDERGKIATHMSYQHDLILKYNGELKIIGSVKTSSKDRIDKVFIDKLLYNRLTGVNTPHIAIFLNDVQRKPGKNDGEYGVSGTFLPGHFKGYTVSLNPLDGVYYCDILPNMRTDPFLSEHIDTIDKFFFDDLRPLLSRSGEPLSELIIDEDPV